MRTPQGVILALFLLTAAGCTDPGPATDQSATQPPPVQPPENVTLLDLQAMAPVLLGGGVGEPSIATGPDNTVYVADPFMTIWRSTDGGVTYKQAASKGMEGGGDGDLSVGSDGTIHWLGLGGPTGPIPYQTSKDGGESFGKAKDLSDKKGFDREWIDAAPDGSIYTSWRDDRGLVFRGSRDNGATWDNTTKVRADTLGGPVVHDPSSDAIFLPFVASDQVSVAVSHDFGKSWKAADAGAVTGSLTSTGTDLFPVVAVDLNGTAYLVYSADSAAIPTGAAAQSTRYGVFLSVSHDHGASWSAPALISDPAKSAIMPWVTAGKAGRVAIVWYENTYGVPSDSLPDEWNVRLWESVNADAASPASKQVLLNKEAVHVGPMCGGGRCRNGGDRTHLDFFEVAINTAGQPVVTWVSSLPFQYPASVIVGGPLAVKVYAGGLATGAPLL